jgi:stage IV sporulation protein B
VRLVSVGQSVGIKLFSHGVMIVGLENVEGPEGSVSPARESGLKVGDIITQLDGKSVNSIEEVAAVLEENAEQSLTVTALRKGRELSTTAQPCLSPEGYKLGAWVRDSMAGIGTVTWYDPKSRTFCALGHGISDVDTNVLMPLKNGGIMSASVTAVEKGGIGAPGQLHGSFDLTRDLGSLTGNTDCGVYGTLYEGEFSGRAMDVAPREEVHPGSASILCNVEGEEVQEYSVEILRIYPSAASQTRNLMVQVTDQALLEKTGGIVQGMSGSPILQDGKLAGAVTHVLINDPTRGYGILAENMVKAAP